MAGNLFRKLAVVFFLIFSALFIYGASLDSLDEFKAEILEEVNVSPEDFLLYHSADGFFEDNSDIDIIENTPPAGKDKSVFPFEMNELVREQIIYLTETKRDFMIRSIKRAEDYVYDMRLILREAGLPEELVYLPIIESGFNYHAYSIRGAAGMWQFMPATASWIGMKRNEWMDERLDPLISCKYAAVYLNTLYELFGDWYLALASYNYGRGNVSRALRKIDNRDYYTLIEKKIIPVETQKYVPRFKAVVYIMNNLEEFGFEYNEKITEYQYVNLDFTSTVRLTAQYSGLSQRDFLSYNPAIRSQFVPGGRIKYSVRLPKENAEILVSNLLKLKNESFSDFVVYSIKKGDNLSSIAQYFGVSVNNIMTINGITNSNRIWEGQRIYIPISGNVRSVQNTVTNTAGLTHIVGNGETVSEIALRYGVSADIIARLNNLNSSYFIKAGQVLKIR